MKKINDNKINRFIDIFDGYDIAQANINKVKKNVFVGWHGHEKQTDYFYVIDGIFRIGMARNKYDTFDWDNKNHFYNVEYYYMTSDEQNPLVIPPHTYHSYELLSGTGVIVFGMKNKFDPTDVFEQSKGWFGINKGEILL